MIDWEVGDATFWVSFSRGKPFMVHIFKKEGNWNHRVIRDNPLTAEQKTKVEEFVRERLADLKHAFNSNMKTRLNWDVSLIGRKEK